MRSKILSLFFLFAFVHMGVAILCYECNGNETMCGPEAVSTVARNCTTTDICFFHRIVESEGGSLHYERSCQVSADVTNGEKNKCTDFKFFGQKNHICACDDKDLCNGAVRDKASLFSVVLVATAVGVLAVVTSFV